MTFDIIKVLDFFDDKYTIRQNELLVLHFPSKNHVEIFLKYRLNILKKLRNKRGFDIFEHMDSIESEFYLFLRNRSITVAFDLSWIAPNSSIDEHYSSLGENVELFEMDGIKNCQKYDIIL